MPLKKQKIAKRRKPSTPPRRMSTKDLCKSLAGVAAFHVEDGSAQLKIYEAIRRLQMLDAAGVEAGILPQSLRPGQ
jgi:hypothetical protein